MGRRRRLHEEIRTLLPGKAAYKYFGFDPDSLTAKVLGYLEMIKQDDLLRREFVEL